MPGLGLERAPLLIQEQAWAVAALNAIVAGSFVGAVLGTFIGWGIHGGDAYPFDQGLEFGRVLLKLHAEALQADQTWEIMAQVNREAKARSQRALA